MHIYADIFIYVHISLIIFDRHVDIFGCAEELVQVEAALSMTARPSPSYASDGVLFSCHLENAGSEPLEVQQLQCFTSQLSPCNSQGAWVAQCHGHWREGIGGWRSVA